MGLVRIPSVSMPDENVPPCAFSMAVCELNAMETFAAEQRRLATTVFFCYDRSIHSCRKERL